MNRQGWKMCLGRVQCGRITAPSLPGMYQEGLLREWYRKEVAH